MVNCLSSQTFTGCFVKSVGARRHTSARYRAECDRCVNGPTPKLKPGTDPASDLSPASISMGGDPAAYTVATVPAGQQEWRLPYAEVDRHADRHPDQKPNPGQPGEVEHQPQARQDGGDRQHRHPGNPESAWQVRAAPTQHDDTGRDQYEREQRADVHHLLEACPSGTPRRRSRPAHRR